jgi:3-dehydroquinate dehydratase II
VLLARKESRELLCFQSNAEHELIARIQQAAAEKIGVLIFNPGAFTHTSIALRDAVLGMSLPMIEVHLSNPQAREEFRRRSYFSDIAIGVISGFGPLSYELAVRAACRHLASS